MDIKNRKGNIIALSTAVSLVIVALVIYFAAFTATPSEPEVEFASLEQEVFHLKKYR